MTEKEGHCCTSSSMTNMVWYIVLILMRTSHSESLTINLRNEGLDTVPRNMDSSVTELLLDMNNLVTLNSNSFDDYALLTGIYLERSKTTYHGTFGNQENLV